MKTFKTTLKYQDWQSLEDTLLHAGRARQLGIDRDTAVHKLEDSVRYKVLDVKARNLHHARHVALENQGTGWSIFEITELGVQL